MAHKMEWWLLLGGEIIEGCLEEEALRLIDSLGLDTSQCCEIVSLGLAPE